MVFLPGWEEEVFPSRRSLDEQGARGLEEERRLAYVGLTRARERAYLSFVANRQIYGRWTSVLPSRFIDELPAPHVDAVSETGYSPQSGYGSGRMGGSFGNGESAFRSTYDSPGWRRAVDAVQREAEGRRNAPRPPDIEASGRLLASSATSEGGLSPGVRVFHQKFGYGRVTVVEGAKLTVDFDKAGVKKVVESFVERA